MSCNDVAISIIMDEMFCSDPITTSLTLKDVITFTKVNSYLRDRVKKYINQYISKIKCISYIYNGWSLNKVEYKRISRDPITDKDECIFLSYDNIVHNFSSDRKYNRVTGEYEQVRQDYKNNTNIHVAHCPPKSTKQIVLWAEKCGFEYTYKDSNALTNTNVSLAIIIDRNGILYIVTPHYGTHIEGFSVFMRIDGLNLITLCNSLNKFRLKSILDGIETLTMNNQVNVEKYLV